ncbi:MAG: VapC toxin family PIN domain ribonuclease [Rhizobiaceae bacterium]|nr:VapC toxin family PIN domain ribonuclease [Rhizobiaceae bacterium]
MTFLLDVNVLIALVDPSHINHEVAHRWFETEGLTSWATCPITENGFIRITSHPKYPNAWPTANMAVSALARLRRLPGHLFWPDGVSLADGKLVDPTLIVSHASVTDTYLLALAVLNSGRLATFDRKLSPLAVSGGAAALHLIPPI